MISYEQWIGEEPYTQWISVWCEECGELISAKRGDRYATCPHCRARTAV